MSTARKPVYGFVLSHEQFAVPQLIDVGIAAELAGFQAAWASDHFQPWQANQGHAGSAPVTLAALGQCAPRLVMGTGVTCPIYRYHPAVVAQVYATLAELYPGRIFLGLGTGERFNEEAAGGGWGPYDERAERLSEAVQIIRQLWSGEQVEFQGRFWDVQAKLYDCPPVAIPIYMAASGPKSARRAGRCGDGLVVSNGQLLQDAAFREAFEEGARSAGREPSTMPILVEHYAVVGDQEEARHGANFWRFSPKSFEPGFYDNLDPRDIQRRAESEVDLDAVTGKWTVSQDADEHAGAIRSLTESGATHVFVHSPQPEQLPVVDFFGREVLPKLPA